MSFLLKGHFQTTSLLSKACILAKGAYFGKDLILNMPWCLHMGIGSKTQVYRSNWISIG